MAMVSVPPRTGLSAVVAAAAGADDATALGLAAAEALAAEAFAADEALGAAPLAFAALEAAGAGLLTGFAPVGSLLLLLQATARVTAARDASVIRRARPLIPVSLHRRAILGRGALVCWSDHTTASFQLV